MPQDHCGTCEAPLAPDAAYCSSCGSMAPTAVSEPRPDAPTAGSVEPLGERLSRALGPKYEVRRLLGQGGFAEVYEVWDSDLQRRLAVKVLKPDIAWSAGMLDRFKHETRTIARLNHANILPIHFVGEGEGLVYYAMPIVDGQSLAALLKTQGALEPDRALAIARPILDALQHAHESGLVHRDIKPDNVMIEAGTGRPLLVDFGIAKRLDGGPAHQTQTGFVVGTPQYMSPEQALGQGDIDARADIYAMGAMLFQMVTGAPPYDGDTSQEIVGKHLTEPAPLATARNARIPMWLSEVIVRCLAKRPAERFQSASALLEALARGRVSGATESVSAERVVKRIQQEATELLPNETPGGMRAGAAATPTSHIGWVLPALLLLAIVAAGYLWLAGGPLLVVENRLADPVTLTLDGKELRVAPGGTLRHRVRRGRALAAQWALVRPVSPDGKPLGSELSGTIAVERPRGRITRVIDARSGGADYFAPLITNATAASIGVVVNAGLATAVACDCRVKPGAVRAHIGYYPLYLNSSVEATLPGASPARFTDLGQSVDRSTGTVGLRFEPKDFRQ